MFLYVIFIYHQYTVCHNNRCMVHKYEIFDTPKRRDRSIREIMINNDDRKPSRLASPMYVPPSYPSLYQVIHSVHYSSSNVASSCDTCLG